MRTKKEITVLVLPKFFVTELSLSMEQLLNDIKNVIRVYSAEDNNTVKELLKSAHDVMLTALDSSFTGHPTIISDDDYIFHSEKFHEAIEDGKQLFKSITTVDDINHDESEAGTYNLDTPVWYGIFTDITWQSLIDEQKKLLSTPFGLVEKANAPESESTLLKSMISLLDIKKSEPNNNNILVFIEKDELHYDDY